MTKFCVLAALGILLVEPEIVQPQAYPSKPIRLILPAAAGGSPDIIARVMSNELSRQMGQQVVVDNRGGASGMIGLEMIARAAPDGYTVGYATFPIVTNPSLYKKLPYDVLRDFHPVTLQLLAVNLLTVSPSLPIQSVKDLIAHARANPDRLSYGSTGAGASNQLAMELFKSMTGTRITPVNYKAVQQATLDVMSGQIQLICDNLASILPHARTGKVRPLGVTSLKRTPAAPDIPSIDEAGVSGFEITPWSGYVVPARTSRDIVLRLNAEINKALVSQAMVEKLAAVGYTAAGGTPEQFAEHIRKEIEKWAKVIKAAGIQPQ